MEGRVTTDLCQTRCIYQRLAYDCEAERLKFAIRAVLSMFVHLCRCVCVCVGGWGGIYGHIVILVSILCSQ